MAHLIEQMAYVGANVINLSCSPAQGKPPRSSQPPWPSGDDQASAAQSGGLTGLAVM